MKEGINKALILKFIMYKCESCQTGFSLLGQDEKDYLLCPHYDETIQTTKLLEENNARQ